MSSRLLMLSCLPLLGCPKAPTTTPDHAVAALIDARGRVIGSVQVFPDQRGVRVDARIYSLPRDSRWDLSLRASGSCGGPSFSDAGAPWRPPGTSTPTRFGPLSADDRGRSALRATDPSLTIRGTANGVMGRSVVLVEDRPDTLPRACGTFAAPAASEVQVGGEQPQMTEAWEL